MRPGRYTTLMDTAYIWARRSTCDRLHVGAVFHRDGRILVQGYNGAPAGLPHCDHSCTCEYPNEVHAPLSTCPSQQPCTRAVHAEQSGISFAARLGVELKGASLSVTHQPCLPCAQSIINAGIEVVHYVEPYRLLDGLHLLEEAGIGAIRMIEYQPPA